MASSEDWEYMDTLHAPVYICLRRKIDFVAEKPMKLDGRVDKDEWAHVPWSEPFVDIQGVKRKPKTYPLTRFKMMYDEDTLYVGTELFEPKIWGTLTYKNSTMYHENDFEVFFNPDGSRHHYYELEINCLNTIWELLLHRPYKDGHSIVNPYNLTSLRSAVFVDGVANSPETECVRWCVEMSWSFAELQQFDKLRFTQHQLQPQLMSKVATPFVTSCDNNRSTVTGHVWRVNFSRVQYELEVEDTTPQQYRKVPNKSEDNIVWAPTGVIDIHRPERWGYVFFSSDTALSRGKHELADARKGFLNTRMATERVLDAVYYRQRAFYASHGGYASSMEILYTDFATNAQNSLDSDWSKIFPFYKLLQQYKLEFPVLSSESEFVKKKVCDEILEGRSLSYQRIKPFPKLTNLSQEMPRSDMNALITSTYVATVRCATQEWHIRHDGCLWQTA